MLMRSRSCLPTLRLSSGILSSAQWMTATQAQVAARRRDDHPGCPSKRVSSFWHLWIVGRVFRITALLSLVVLFPSCSSQSVASPDELRSNLNSAVSFASEAETFIDYALEGRPTRHYAEGHLDYLGEEINQLGKELN